MTFALRVGCALLVLTACQRKSSDNERRQPQAKLASDRAPKRAAASAEPVHAPAPVELLRRTDAEVSVSSLQDASSRAAWLVDGRAETAWRANPPDPAPWIELVLPAAVSIRSIALVPAAALTAAEVISVLRDDQELGRLEAQEGRLRFAPPQPLAGGRFRLAWQAKAPRSAAGYSQLSVWGEAPPTLLLPEATPFSHVQRTSGVYAAWQLGAPYPSFEALCSKYHQLRSARPEDASKDDHSPPTTSRCERAQTLKTTGQAPPGMRRAHIVAVARGPQGEYAGPSAEYFPKLLLFETDRGWFPSDIVVDSDRGGLDDRASVAYVTRVKGAAWVDGHLELDVLSRLLISGGYPPDGPFNAAGRFVISCDVKEKAVCYDELIGYGDLTPDVFGAFSEPTRFAELQHMPKQWQWTRPFSVAASGHLRLGDCQDGTPDKRGSVPCFSPDASRLR